MREYSREGATETEARVSGVGQEIRRLREARGWIQAKLAVEAGMAPSAVNQIENGKRSPSANSLNKLAGALEVEIADLFPKAPRRSSLELSLVNGEREEERPTARWSAAVDQAQRLRESGRARMEEALKAWRASKERGDAPAARRRHLDKMGTLLQQAYDVQIDLFVNFSGAPPTRTRRDVGTAEANSTPDSNWEEVRQAGDFYSGLRGMVEAHGLFVMQGEKRNTFEVEEVEAA